MGRGGGMKSAQGARENQDKEAEPRVGEKTFFEIR